jgi:hypothetical protein
MFLVLAQVEIFNCQLRQPVSTAQQRNARPSKSPYIASGLATGLKWKQEPGGIALRTAVGFTIGSPYSVFIDTSSGGFQANPSYIARLVGPRVVNLPGAAGGAATSILVDAIINIPPSGVSPNDFVIEIFPVAASLNDLGGDTTKVPAPAWDVVWLGVEG